MQLSATSQIPAVTRQTWPPATTPQAPFVAAPLIVLQAWQSVVTPPPQAVSQHTPSAQKPLPQSGAEVHAPPSTWVKGYSSAVASRPSELTPPATSTFPSGNEVAVWWSRALIIEPTALHVAVTGS